MQMNTNSRRMVWVKKRFLIHFGLLFLLFAGLTGFIFFQSFLRQMRYKPVLGTIWNSMAEPCPDGMFAPKITFSYTVDRMTYRTGKYRDDGMQICLKEVEAQDLLAKYPKGAVVDAWYDPENFKFAVLDHSLGIVQKIFLIVFAGFSAILMIAWWFNHLEKRKLANHVAQGSSNE